MDLSSLILVIINQLDGERTIYSGLHLLRGKRSGQTLQDVEYYSLKDFFGILPKLHIELYDEAAEELKKSAYILIDDDLIVHLTEKGREVVFKMEMYHFNGWDYRGREVVFYERLSLIIQTISNFKSGVKLFLPIQKNHEIQQFVKNKLSGLPITDFGFSQQVRQELQKSIEQSGMKDVQKIILAHRLGGYQFTGWTWEQLAVQLDISSTSVYLYFIESLHLLLGAIERSDEMLFLRKIAEDIKVSSYLTDSSRKTKSYFESGFSLEEIAEKRRLKMSTIEDHFVEMSINDSNFPIEQFVSRLEIESVVIKVNQLATKRLRLLKEEFPALTYFQLRLILGSQSGGDSKWTYKKS